MIETNEKDWKAYRKKIAAWQENYIEKRLDVYKKILNENSNPSERFWKLDKIMNNDKKNPGVLIVSSSRNKLFFIILELLNYKVIGLEDLNDFSAEFVENIKSSLNK